MENKRNLTIGLVLVAIGVFLIVQKTIGLDIEVWSFIWPLFLLIPGIVMHINYFTKDKKSGGLIVAGILTTYGALFLFNTLTYNMYHEKLNFIYFLGIGIGFLENYLFGSKKYGDLSATLVFTIISIIIFLKDVFPNLISLRDYVLPGILILFGVLILFRKAKN